MSEFWQGFVFALGLVYMLPWHYAMWRQALGFPHPDWDLTKILYWRHST